MFFIMLILSKSFFKEFSKKFSIICKNWFRNSKYNWESLINKLLKSIRFFFIFRKYSLT